MTKVRKRHNAEFKSKIAIEAIKEEKTINELTAEYGVHATQISNQKKQALAVIPSAFNTKQQDNEQAQQATIDEPHRQLGQVIDLGIATIMDGRGRALDNISVERLWRSVEYECVYLHQFDTVNQARVGLKDYFEFYNYERLHQSLRFNTLAQVYLNNSSDNSALYQPNSILIS